MGKEPQSAKSVAIRMAICVAVALVGWVVPPPASMTLRFSIPPTPGPGLFDSSKEGEFPDKLRTAFEKHGIKLSKKAKLLVVRPDKEWIVSNGMVSYDLRAVGTGVQVRSKSGWRTFWVFSATILSFLIRPLAMGPMVLIALVALSVTGSLAYKPLIGGFGNSTVWLVVAAFLIAGAVQRTGFGRRIALTLVRWLGRSMLGLGYALCGSELILGPVVPSNTARGGGIIAPIVRSLSAALDSHPLDRPDRAGQFLTLTASHANLITASMFLTAMAANPLVSEAAADVLDVDFGWGTWALGAIVPGLVGLALLPLLIRWLSPPTITDTTAAQETARKELADMGPWSRGEKIMAAVFVMLIGLWSTSAWHGMNSGLVAWIGVLVLIVTNTERYEDVTANDKAWDTLIWLGGLLAMAKALKSEGVVDWFADNMGAMVAGLSPITLAIVLALIYFYSMYGFSMFTGHITALVAAFFAVGAAAPPMLMVALIAYFSCLCGAMTNYSTGPVVIHFGSGYVGTGAWFRIGFVVGLFHLAVWLTVGMAWWWLLGWY